MDVTKISFPSGIDADDLAFSNLVAQMAGDYAFFGAGSLSDAEIASLDSAFAWDTALAGSFNSLGELAESSAKIESKLSTLRSRKYRLPGRRASSISLTLAGISQLQKKYLESSAFSSTPITIVLRSRDKGEIVIFNGLRWTVDWSGEVDGLFQVVISAEFHGTTTGKIYAVSGIPTTGIFMINEMLPFAAWSGETTPTQSFRLAAYQVPSPITLTAPTGFQISTAESSGYAAELTLPATFNGTIYARLISETLGAHSGTISAVAEGTAAKTSAVSGYLGDGSEAKPYPVSKPEHFDAIRNNPDAHYIQLGDIDLTAYGQSYNEGHGWIALGSYESPLTGSYDGQNHLITGLYINNDSDLVVSLFGVAQSNAVISNLTVSGAVVTASSSTYCTAILFSHVTDCTITNVHVRDMVLTGHGTAAGFAATLESVEAPCLVSGCSVTGTLYASGSGAAGFTPRANGKDLTISYCWVNVKIISIAPSGSQNGYAAFGNAMACNIDTCYATGSISNAEEDVAGFASSFDSMGDSSKIDKCYAAVKMSSKTPAYGFCAAIYAAVLSDCFFDSQLLGSENEAENGASPLPTEEMRKAQYFTNWDFSDTWSIIEAATYPTLKTNPER